MTSTARMLILGASNVVRSFSVILDTARLHLGTPLDVVAAVGHGRSYGIPSTVMGRRLPGILQCDLWEEWPQRDPCPTFALVTDVGNDILYGQTPRQIADWVETCLERILLRTEIVVMTELPLETTAGLRPRRFLMLRSILFPKSRITYEEALDKAHELNDRVVALAGKFGATIVKPQRQWYGIDPIHVLAAAQRDAWQTILASWKSDGNGQTLARASQLQLWLARPKYREVFGLEQRRTQPAVHLLDGTRVSLY